MSFNNLSRAKKVLIVSVFIYGGINVLNSIIKYFIAGETDGILIAAIATVPMAIIMAISIVASKYQADR